MNKTQALKEAVKRWGKKAIVRDEPKLASTPEQRAEAGAKRKLLRETLTKEELKKRSAEMDELLFQTLRQRYSVGSHEGFCICIRGTGDTWEQCFEAADRMWGKAA